MSYNTHPTNIITDQPSAPKPHGTFITSNGSHVVTQTRTWSANEEFIYWLHQGNLQVYYTNGSNMKHINSRQVPPEARLIREIGFYHHLLQRDSNTRRGICWTCDPSTYHHELKCDEKDEECEIKEGTLGDTILKIITSRLLNIMEYVEKIEA